MLFWANEIHSGSYHLQTAGVFLKRSQAQIMDLVKKLHQVPHLRLPFNFDVQKMQQELESIQKWTPHSHAGFREISEEQMRRFSRGYSGVSLYEFNGEMDYATDNYEIFEGKESNITRDPNDGHILFLPTSLVEKVPYISSVVDTISNRKGRTRIMRSEPNHSIVWHSHNRGPWYNDYMLEAIVHVPIKAEPAVLHSVRDYRHADAEIQKFSSTPYDKLVSDQDVISQHYSEGECWLFNSWHDHYYHNYSSSVRYSLLLYIRWFYNEAFLDMVEGALADYRGPLLPP